MEQQGDTFVFRGARLAAIVAEFNRHNLSPKFRLTDAKAGERRLNGVFNIDGAETLALVLSHLGDLCVTREGDEVFVRMNTGDL